MKKSKLLKYYMIMRYMIDRFLLWLQEMEKEIQFKF